MQVFLEDSKCSSDNIFNIYTNKHLLGNEYGRTKVVQSSVQTKRQLVLNASGTSSARHSKWIT